MPSRLMGDATGLLLCGINAVRLSDDSRIVGDGPVNLMYFRD